MRLGTLVLVGYAAEDAAMRLLLDTLDADRDRFRDLNDIYAIEKGTVDLASLWKAKGIKPVELTPDNATAFEREQLGFFLSQGDLATMLATLNPSLAWLPICRK